MQDEIQLYKTSRFIAEHGILRTSVNVCHIALTSRVWHGPNPLPPMETFWCRLRHAHPDIFERAGRELTFEFG